MTTGAVTVTVSQDAVRGEGCAEVGLLITSVGGGAQAGPVNRTVLLVEDGKVHKNGVSHIRAELRAMKSESE